MPFPYHAIPQLAVWQSDSTVYFAFRASDHVLQTIDNLLAAYHDPNLAACQPENLFYLRLALMYWFKNVNVVPRNAAPTNFNSTNLPGTPKVSGSDGRAAAISALLVVVNQVLRANHHVASDLALDAALKTTYGADNHGVVADQAWFAKYGANPGIKTVYLTDDGVRRQNKLRFRDGIAWRWNTAQNTYVRFDSLDNRESEANDQMVHFVLDQRGRIYAGFDRTADWFKHTSLVGGSNSYAAGRMKVQNGIVMLIENDSGHFFPNHQHMRNLLQRLRLYGANVQQTVVRRVSDKHTFTSTAVMNSLNAWPDGVTTH